MDVLIMLVLGSWFAAFGVMNTVDFIYWLMMISLMILSMWAKFSGLS